MIFFLDCQEFHVYVGPADEVTQKKTIILPHPAMEVSPIPENYQKPEWNDRFIVNVENEKLTVFRYDYVGGSGWSQDLVLRASHCNTVKRKLY